MAASTVGALFGAATTGAAAEAAGCTVAGAVSGMVRMAVFSRGAAGCRLGSTGMLAVSAGFSSDWPGFLGRILAES